LSDLHLGAMPDAALAGYHVRDSFQAVLRAALATVPEPAAVLLTGDLAERAECAAYDWLARALEPVPCPVLALAGNHDASPLMTRRLRSVASVHGSLDIGPWRIITLDTSVSGSEAGRLSPAELARCAQALEEARDRFALIALHHPPVSIASPWMDAMGLGNAKEFWHAVERHRTLRAVLWGHVHQNFDWYRGRVRVLGAPSTCVQFMPRATAFARDPRPPGYRVLHLDDEGTIATEVRRVPEAQALDYTGARR
jgi:Icc protein